MNFKGDESMRKSWRVACLLSIAIVGNCVSCLADEPLQGVYYPADVRPKVVLQQEAEISTEAIAFSPDSKTVVTAGNLFDKARGENLLKVRFWDAKTGQKLRELKNELPPNPTLKQILSDPWRGGLPLIATYSPDGKTLAVLSGAVSLWDVQTGEILRTLSWSRVSTEALYVEDVTSIAFSPDCKKLVVGTMSGFNKVRVFDVKTGEQVRVLTTPGRHSSSNDSPLPVVLSPDGKLIATGGTSVRLWDAQ